MEIASRQQLKDELLEVCRQNGFTGPLANMLASVNSTSYYNILSRGISISRETNINTAVNYNSLIALAMKRMYSVFRGTCPKLTVSGTSSKLQTLKRGDLIYSGSDFNLYVEQDTDLPVNIRTDIPVIASPAYHEISKMKESNSYFVEFRTPNLSEDFILYKQVNQEGENTVIVQKTTRIFREHEKNSIPLEMTIQDFGVRFYSNDLQDENSILSVFEYLENGNQLIEDFLFDIIKYNSNNEKTIDLTLTIKGFKLLDIDLSKDESRNVTGYASFKETKSEIRNHYSYQLNTLFLIRSNSDFLEVFNLRFSSYIIESYCETYNNINELPDVALINRVPKRDSYPNTIIYYTPRSKSSVISEDMVADFLDEVRYFNVGNLISVCPGEMKSLDIEITAVKATNDAMTDIKNLLDSYSGKFNVDFPLAKIHSDIDKLNSVVGISEFKITLFTSYNLVSYGYYLNGSYVNDVDYEYYEFDVNPNDIVRVTGINPRYHVIEYYDSSDRFMSYVSNSETSKGDYIVPDGVSKCRVSLLTGDNLVQLGQRVDDVSCRNQQYILINSKINIKESWN